MALSATILLAGSTRLCQGQTNTWTGGTGDWFDSGNWSSGVPDGTSGAFITGDGVAQISTSGALVGTGLYIGQGTLVVGSGGSLTEPGLVLGGNPNINGNSASNPTVSANLTIEGGGTVTSTGNPSIGYALNSAGHVTVDGSGSSWSMPSLSVGVFYGTAATLTIQNGGAVATTNGGSVSTGGAVTIDGSGSTWTLGGSQSLSVDHSGTLDIKNGGGMLLTGIFSSSNSGGTTISDANSYLRTSDVQLQGASMTVADGGTLSVDTGSPGSGGGRVLMNLGAQLQFGTGGTSGTLNAALVRISSGSNTLVFDHSDDVTYAFTIADNTSVSGAGLTLDQEGTGTTRLTGTVDLSILGSASVAVTAGKLLIDTDFAGNGNTHFTVSGGGTLGGSGTIEGHVAVNSGGIIAPGDSPGLLTVTGNLTLASGSFTDMQLGGTIRGTGYDVLVVDGALTFGGTLDVSLYNGFNPTTGESFDLFDWGSESGTFSSIDLPTLTPGLSWDTSALYTSGEIAVTGTAIPEPVAYGGWTGALMFGWTVLRRCKRGFGVAKMGPVSPGNRLGAPASSKPSDA